MSVVRVIPAMDHIKSHLNKKAKKSDPNDTSLGVGKGFFVAPDIVRPVVAKSYESDETKVVSSTI